MRSLFGKTSVTDGAPPAGPLAVREMPRPDASLSVSSPGFGGRAPEQGVQGGGSDPGGALRGGALSPEKCTNNPR